MAVQAQEVGQAQANVGGRSWWQVFRSILIQLVIFYFITSFFRGRRQQTPVAPEGRHPAAGGNLFPKGQEMVCTVYTCLLYDVESRGQAPPSHTASWCAFFKF